MLNWGTGLATCTTMMPRLASGHESDCDDEDGCDDDDAADDDDEDTDDEDDEGADKQWKWC